MPQNTIDNSYLLTDSECNMLANALQQAENDPRTRNMKISQELNKLEDRYKTLAQFPAKQSRLTRKLWQVAVDNDLISLLQYCYKKDGHYSHVYTATGNTIFHQLAMRKYQHHNILRFFSKNGIRHEHINKKNTDGQTPLHLAIREGSEQLLALLMSLGANSRIKDNIGVSAYHLAKTHVCVGNRERRLEILQNKVTKSTPLNLGHVTCYKTFSGSGFSR